MSRRGRLGVGTGFDGSVTISVRFYLFDSTNICWSGEKDWMSSVSFHVFRDWKKKRSTIGIAGANSNWRLYGPRTSSVVSFRPKKSLNLRITPVLEAIMAH